MQATLDIQEVVERVSEHPKPRPYQQDALSAIRSLYERGTTRSLLVAATGMGKAVMLGFLPHEFPNLAKRGMMILVHRTELVYQLAETLKWINPDKKIGIEQADRKADPYYHDYIVASVQTLGHPQSRRLERYTGKIGIIAVDEAHHCSEGSQYQKILDHFGCGPGQRFPLPDGRERLVVGATATPNRSDRKGLHMFFDDIAVDYNIRWGVENGYLVDIKAVRVETGTDVSNVKTRAGDFAINELEAAINTHERNEVIIKGFVEHGGKLGVAFCAGVAQAHSLAEDARALGIDAHAVDGSMDRDERKEIVEAYRKGEFPLLTNCAVFTEGFDVKPVDTVLMARPTKSTLLYTQCIGRGTRPVINPMHPEKEDRVNAIRMSAKPSMTIIDYADNIGKHSIVNAPKLFGLSENFETQGRSVFDLIQTIEALEEEHPEKPIRMATSLEEVNIIAKRMSIWDVAETPEDMKAFTNFMWMNTAEDRYQIHVPGDKDTREQNVVYKLEADDLGRFSVSRIKKALWEAGDLVAPESKVTSNLKFNSLEEAIAGVDRQIEQDHQSALRLIRRGERWMSQPASDAQLGLLKKLGVFIPEGYQLKKGKASALISASLGK